MRRMLHMLVVSVFLIVTSATAQEISGLKETYQHVVEASRKGDFAVLKSNLILQQGLTFDSLEGNWDKAQPTFQKIFHPFEEITIVESLKGKEGSTYWIIEINAVEQGNKHLKVFKFTPDSLNKTGWRIATTPHFGSYNYPDQAGIREGVIKDITKKILLEG